MTILRRLALLALAAALTTAPLCAQPLVGPPAGDKAMAPGLDDIKVLSVLSDRYLFGPMLVRGTGGRLHMQFFRGQDHYWRRPARIGYAYSDDDGRNWTQAPDPLADEAAETSDRLSSFGQTRSGVLVSVFMRRAPGQPLTVRQTSSGDGGRTWSASRVLHMVPDDPTLYNGKPFYPYGAIKRTPKGTLAFMTYAGEDNSVLVSRDDGETWTRHVVVTSKQPNYSEMGLEVIDENTWIAVSRIDGQSSRMAQFVSHDAGQTWRLEGPLNLPAESSANAAPTIDTVKLAGRKSVVLSYCDRRPKLCWLQVGDPARVVDDPQAWGNSKLFDRGFSGRSGYQSFVVDRGGERLIGAMVRERADESSEIVVFQTARIADFVH